MLLRFVVKLVSVFVVGVEAWLVLVVHCDHKMTMCSQSQADSCVKVVVRAQPMREYNRSQVLFANFEPGADLCVHICWYLKVDKAASDEGWEIGKAKHCRHAVLEASDYPVTIRAPLCCVIFTFDTLLINGVKYICLQVLFCKFSVANANCVRRWWAWMPDSAVVHCSYFFDELDTMGQSCSSWEQ